MLHVVLFCHFNGIACKWFPVRPDQTMHSGTGLFTIAIFVLSRAVFTVSQSCSAGNCYDCAQDTNCGWCIGPGSSPRCVHAGTFGPSNTSIRTHILLFIDVTFPFSLALCVRLSVLSPERRWRWHAAVLSEGSVLFTARVWRLCSSRLWLVWRDANM